MREGLAEPRKCAETLAILSDPDRLRIVRALARGPRTVGEIATLLDAPLGNASHHLRSLWLANLLSREKRGRHVLYSLRAGILSEPNDASPGEIRYDLGCCSLTFPSAEGERGE